MMDHQRKPGYAKQFSSSAVNFAPLPPGRSHTQTQSLTRDPRIYTGSVDLQRERMDLLYNKHDRQDSLALPGSGSFLVGQTRRESATLANSHSHHAGKALLMDPHVPAYNECRFSRQWKSIAALQIVAGLLAIFVNLYSHYPIFSCGWKLADDEDKLWFGTWIGLLDFICGIIGMAASKSGISFSLHKLLRRTYFILNCSFVPFANGIGIGAYGITLSAYKTICNGSPVEQFTLVMAFIHIVVLAVALILNILGVVYQVLATMRCKCWICDPKNKSHRGYVKT